MKVWSFFPIFLSLALLASCTSVVPIVPSPEDVSLSEAEEIIQKSLEKGTHFENIQVNELSFSFREYGDSKRRTKIHFEDIFNTITQRGLGADGYYHYAFVTVYYKKNMKLKKLYIDCPSLTAAEKLISALAKLKESAKLVKKIRLKDLQEAYQKGILNRQEYLQKKEELLDRYKLMSAAQPKP
ncbi:MAG: SHOCT domain-containing protein [Planctomycetota bacterium]|nr:MAG: SHOCT domain-containing protein [Planctomycetota bacterium]